MLLGLISATVKLLTQISCIEATESIAINQTEDWNLGSTLNSLNQSSEEHYHDYLKTDYGDYFIVTSLSAIALVSLCILCGQCFLWIVSSLYFSVSKFILFGCFNLSKRWLDTEPQF